MEEEIRYNLLNKKNKWKEYKNELEVRDYCIQKIKLRNSQRRHLISII